jgi:hypothetical protein
VVVGDLNNDAKPDLVVACGEARAMIVLLSTGGGHFGASNPIPLPDGPGDMVLGDVNGDANLDLASDSHDSYGVVLLLGDGKGGLALAANSPIVMKEGQHPHTHGLETLIIAHVIGAHDALNGYVLDRKWHAFFSSLKIPGEQSPCKNVLKPCRPAIFAGIDLHIESSPCLSLESLVFSGRAGMVLATISVKPETVLRRKRRSRILGRLFPNFTLCATSAISVSRWLTIAAKTHHGDTENTEVAQRLVKHYIPREEISPRTIRFGFREGEFYEQDQSMAAHDDRGSGDRAHRRLRRGLLDEA